MSKAFELGLLNIQTENVDSAPGENFSVVRLRRNLGGCGIQVRKSQRKIDLRLRQLLHRLSLTP